MITDVVTADADAILLLENIIFLNYVNENRKIGLDTETTLAVLKVCDDSSLSRLIC